jgi:hypothetical protein
MRFYFISPQLWNKHLQNQTFEVIVMKVKEFIEPITSALASRKPSPSKWSTLDLGH